MIVARKFCYRFKQLSKSEGVSPRQTGILSCQLMSLSAPNCITSFHEKSIQKG